MSGTMWGRNDHADSLDALAFLKERKLSPARVLDIARQPPGPREWAQISDGLGSLVDAVDKRHPDFFRVFHNLDRLDEKKIAMRLHERPEFIRLPLLLTEKGALAGFQEREWLRFFEMRKGRT